MGSPIDSRKVRHGCVAKADEVIGYNSAFHVTAGGTNLGSCGSFSGASQAFRTQNYSLNFPHRGEFPIQPSDYSHKLRLSIELKAC